MLSIFRQKLYDKISKKSHIQPYSKGKKAITIENVKTINAYLGLQETHIIN